MWEEKIRLAARDLDIPLTDQQVREVETQMLRKARLAVPTARASDFKVLTRRTWRVAVGEACRILGLRKK